MASTANNTLFRIEDDSTEYLLSLARRFPTEFNKALASLGYNLRLNMLAAMKNNGKSLGLEPLSTMRQYRRMELGKKAAAGNLSGKGANAFELKKGPKKSTQSIPNALKRYRSARSYANGNEKTIGGQIAQVVRYNVDKSQMRVDIGTLTTYASKFFAAVQGGERGGKGSFPFAGTQPVTPKMRRAFWAAGVPLARTTMSIKQPERPIVSNVYKNNQAWIREFLINKVYKIVSDKQKSKGINYLF
ncbi:MAG: hypothetical protein R3Y11_00480 [Pseudomonadota bacterium]